MCFNAEAALPTIDLDTAACTAVVIADGGRSSTLGVSSLSATEARPTLCNDTVWKSSQHTTTDAKSIRDTSVDSTPPCNPRTHHLSGKHAPCEHRQHYTTWHTPHRAILSLQHMLFDRCPSERSLRPDFVRKTPTNCASRLPCTSARDHRPTGLAPVHRLPPAPARAAACTASLAATAAALLALPAAGALVLVAAGPLPPLPPLPLAPPLLPTHGAGLGHEMVAGQGVSTCTKDASPHGVSLMNKWKSTPRRIRKGG